ncbi:MAG: putative ribose/galactose/methyl galactoside import ATP-binding protein 1 [Firmicutes bacterium]|nr:putative ribose/galactose/methyl galactoside import ATP-binding protein 1 [Bacillota bacterium]
MAEPVLEMTAITKRFPGVTALDGVDLTLHAGEVHALMGENGAGKSTLMKILGGVYRKDEGRMLLRGQEIELNGPRHAMDIGIAVVHQELMLCNNLTVAENLFLPDTAHRMPLSAFGWKALYARAQALFDDLGIPLDPRATTADLTIARRQMVEIARTISRDIRILVLDEPTSSLSEEDTAFLFLLVDRLRSKGVSIVFISHRLKEVFQIADRLTVLRDGKKVGTYKSSDLTQESLVTLMVGRNVDLGQRVTGTVGDRLLEVQGLTRRGAFADVSFQVRAGEIVGLAGLVGAGRTEVARAIVGADPVDAGQILVAGKPAQIRSPADATRNGVALVPEDRKRDGLVLEATVANNASMVIMRALQRFGLVRKRELTEVVRDYVKQLNVRTPSLDQEVQYLSGGNQQKVVIAKWLAVKPKVLILDEPTRGIDVGAKAEIYAIMRRLAQEGHAILMISSELPEILALSNRVLVMAEGRLVGELVGDAATEERIMALCHLPHLTTAG